MTDKLIIFGVCLLFIGIVLVIYRYTQSNESFNPIPPLSYQYNAVYKNVDPNNYPSSCSKTIHLLKNGANYDGDAVQILQSGMNIEDSKKCYDDLRKQKKMNRKDFYQYCMEGKTGLPKADVLCMTPDYNKCPSNIAF
jgi:hypothetical protein